MKLKVLLNKKRLHFRNRLKQRGGNMFYFLLAKVIGEKNVMDKDSGKCFVWRYKNHFFLTQNNRLQTYIKNAKEYRY